MTEAEAERFIWANTDVLAPPHVPEISLHLASEAHALWLKTEEQLALLGLPPPFWAFAWAGGQGLARFLLDHPDAVRGRSVLDFASGSGLVAIAARKAGVARVLASDIDPFARTAVRLNGALNGVAVPFTDNDCLGTFPDADLLLAGDVFYERALADRLLPWFAACAARGIEILVGDPGRAYFPTERFTCLAEYQVRVSRALEDAEVKHVRVWRWKEEP